MVKKLFPVLAALFFMPVAYGAAANIHINISGAAGDNRYFLCMPNIGCLSILEGEEGKVYPILHAFNMHNMYITNLQNFRVYAENFPASCDVKVNTNQNIYIYGHIVPLQNNALYVQNMHCVVR